MRYDPRQQSMEAYAGDTYITEEEIRSYDAADTMASLH